MHMNNDILVQNLTFHMENLDLMNHLQMTRIWIFFSLFKFYRWRIVLFIFQIE